jgi:hypothetical protein
MPYDFSNLKPHRPLDPGDPAYVPGHGAEEIVGWVGSGGSPVLIGGPAGIGKSTELAQAAEGLKRSRLAVLAQVDRAANMRLITPAQLDLLIAHHVSSIAVAAQKPLSPELTSLALTDRLSLSTEAAKRFVGATSWTEAAIREVGRSFFHNPPRRPCILIDGIEKCPASTARDLFDWLEGQLKSVDLVVTIPWHLAFGPGAADTFSSSGRLIVLRVRELEASWEEPLPQQDFFQNLLTQRLGLEWEASRALLTNQPFLKARFFSGGVPRTFLQLFGDAARYAKMRRGDPWPHLEDIDQAISDQIHSIRRILLPGDRDLLSNAELISQTEIPLAARIRLLAHGLLLDVGIDSLRVHPLVKEFLRHG